MLVRSQLDSDGAPPGHCCRRSASAFIGAVNLLVILRLIKL
jgi:hypothetical protein